jgi:tRNA (guanine-N(7)-)-methyltransferase
LQLVKQDNFADILEFIRNSRRLEIEIGSGGGHFVADYALKHQGTNFIAIEIKKKRCDKIIRKIRENKLCNVKVFYGNAEKLIKTLPLLSVDAFHIYFPDPWPKTKHRKRRFFKLTMLDMVYCALKTGGEIYFASDVFDYYFQAKILCILHLGFKITKNILPQEVAHSMYSKKMGKAGKNINTLVVSK